MIRLALIFKIAFLNLTRNRTRTLLNISIIVGAFVAIVSFNGFATHIIKGTEDVLTSGQIGHFQIASNEIWNDVLLEKKADAYINRYPDIESKIAKIPGIKTISPRSNAQILMVNGDISIGAFALGFDIKNEKRITDQFVFTEGSSFNDSGDNQILLGAGIHKQLNTHVGQTLSLLSQSLSDAITSVDVEVIGVVKTGLTDVDNQTVYIPIGVAQRLLDTPFIERIVILTDENVNADKIKNQMDEVLKDFPQLKVKTWRELSVLVKQLTEFYAVQNFIVQLILCTLVFLGILNTLGMSIYERITEMGTLRALGDQDVEILLQFIFETIILVVIGILLALPATQIVSFILKVLDIKIFFPGSSLPSDVLIAPEFKDYIFATVVLMVTCLFASVWPVVRALRMNITDMLRFNA